MRARTAGLRFAGIVLVAAIWACGCTFFAGQLHSIRATQRLRKPIAFADAQGPISNAEGKAIIADLEQAVGPTDVLKRHLVFEQAINGGPLLVGNKVILLENGTGTYRAMFQAIEGADDTINLETYEFADDPIGGEVAEALIARRRAGVRVNVIYDSFGSLSTPEAFFDRMRQNGIEVVQFNPLSPIARRLHWPATHRDHRKLMVVDGKIAILGGINITDVYSSSIGSGSFVKTGWKKRADMGSWRDTDIQIEGPAVAECQRLFMEHWAAYNGPPLGSGGYFVPAKEEGDEIVRIIAFSPGRPSLIYITLVSAISNAETNVYMTDAYFAPERRMLDAMEGAARRGVDVRLLLPGTSTSTLVGAAARAHYSELMEAGVKIYEWKGRMLHAKTATVDHVWSTVGSSNLDWWSIVRNDEINATILSPVFGGEMDRMFDADLKNSTSMDPVQWQNRPLMERLKESFAHAIEPLL